MASNGPYSAQIQRAIAGLLAGNNTWTGTNTFSGGAVIPSFTGVNSITFSGGQVLAGTTANLTDLRNGASGQKLRVFGSYTDAANNSYIYLEDAGGNVSRLNTAKNGSGTASDLYLGAGDFSRWIIAAASPHFVPNSNNAADVGSSGSQARTGYFGTSVVIGEAAIYSGTGTPEGTVTAKPGSLYLNNSGGTATGFYFKNTGTGNTGWTSGTDYFPSRSVQRVVPSTGDSITINTTRNSYLLVVPVATIANLTIVFPLAPTDGDEVSISFGVPGTTAANSSVVTTLTVNGNGNSVMAPAASATNNLSAHWRYDSTSTTWYKVF